MANLIFGDGNAGVPTNNEDSETRRQMRHTTVAIYNDEAILFTETGQSLA